MGLKEIVEAIPDYAIDLRLNLTSVMRQTELTQQQLWGTVVACAMASRSRLLVAELLPEAKSHLAAEAYSAAQSAAVIMAMNNIYFRFLHMSLNPKYGKSPASLRMNAIRTHGWSLTDFELWCLSVSAINGCSACVDRHERLVRKRGLSEETVLAAIRIASVLHAVATIIDTESFVESS